MKIKEGFVLRSIVGQHVVIGEGIAQVNFNKMPSLNDTAAFLWKSVEGKEFTVEDLKALLIGEYAIDEELAARDAEKIAARWIEIGLAEE